MSAAQNRFKQARAPSGGSPVQPGVGALLPLAITMGDAAGIGPEIIAKAFRDDPDATKGCFVVGDVPTLRRAAQAIRAA